MENGQSVPAEHPNVELEDAQDQRLRMPAPNFAGRPTSSHLLVNVGPVLKPGTKNYVAVPALPPRRPVLRKSERMPVDISPQTAVAIAESPSYDTEAKCTSKQSAAKLKSCSGASRAEQISGTSQLPSTQPSIQKKAGKDLAASATLPISSTQGSSVDYLYRTLLVDIPGCPLVSPKLPGALNLQHDSRDVQSPSQQVAPHQQRPGSAISCGSLADMKDTANLHMASPQLMYHSSSTPMTRTASSGENTALGTVALTGHRADTTGKQSSSRAMELKQSGTEKRTEGRIKSTIKRHPDGSYSAIFLGPCPTDIRVANSGLKSSPDKSKQHASKKATKSTKGKKAPAKNPSESGQKLGQSLKVSNKVGVTDVVPLFDSHVLPGPESEKGVTEDLSKECSSRRPRLGSHHLETVQQQEALDKSGAKREDAIENQLPVFPQLRNEADLKRAEHTGMKSGVEPAVADRDKQRGKEKGDPHRRDKRRGTAIGKEGSSVRPQEANLPEQFGHNSKHSEVRTRSIAIQTGKELLDAIVHSLLPDCFLTQSGDLASRLSSCDVDEGCNKEPPDNQEVLLDLSLRKSEQNALRASCSATNLLCLEEEDIQAKETKTHCEVYELVRTQDEPDLLWETSEYVAYKERVIYADVDEDVWLNERPCHQSSPFSSPGLPRWSSQNSLYENISSPETVRNMAYQSFGFSPSGVEYPAASDSDSENDDQMDDFSMHSSFSENSCNGCEDDVLLSSPEVPRDEVSGELVEGLEVEGIPLEGVAHLRNPTEDHRSFMDVETSDGLVDDVFEEDMIRGDTPAPVYVRTPLELEVKGHAVDVKVLNAGQEKEDEIGEGTKQRSFYATSSQDEIVTAEMVEVKAQAIEACLFNEKSPETLLAQESESNYQRRKNRFHAIDNENDQMKMISKPDNTGNLLFKQLPKGEDLHVVAESQRSNRELFEEQSPQTNSCSRNRPCEKRNFYATRGDKEPRSMVKPDGRVDTAIRDEEEAVLEEERERRVVGEIVACSWSGGEVSDPEQQGTLQVDSSDENRVETQVDAGSCDCAHPACDAETDPRCFTRNVGCLHPLSAELKTQLLSLLWPAFSVLHSVDQLPELVPTKTEQFLLQKAMDQTIGAVDCFLKLGEFQKLLCMCEGGEKTGAFKATPGWREMGDFVQHGVTALNTLSNRMSELFLQGQYQKRRLKSNPMEFPWVINSEEFVKRTIFSTGSDSSIGQEASVIAPENKPSHSSNKDQPLEDHPSQTGKIVFASPAAYSSAPSRLSQLLKESREARNFPDGHVRQHISENEPESVDLVETSVLEGLARDRNPASGGCESTIKAGNRENRNSTNQVDNCQNQSDQDQGQGQTTKMKRHLNLADHCLQKNKGLDPAQATSGQHGQAGLSTKENSDNFANSVNASKPQFEPAKDQTANPCYSNSQAQKTSERKLPKEPTELSGKKDRKRLHSPTTLLDCDVYCFSDNERSPLRVKYPRNSPKGLPVHFSEARSSEAELRARDSNVWQLPKRSAVVDNLVQLDCSTQERETGQRSSLQRVPETQSRESQFSRSNDKIKSSRSTKMPRKHRSRTRTSSRTPENATNKQKKLKTRNQTDNNESTSLKGDKGHRKANVDAGQGQNPRVMSTASVISEERGTPSYSNRYLENLCEQSKSKSHKAPSSSTVVPVQDVESKKSDTSPPAVLQQKGSSSNHSSIRKPKQSMPSSSQNNVNPLEMRANKGIPPQKEDFLNVQHKQEMDQRDKLTHQKQRLHSPSSSQRSEESSNWSTNSALDLSRGDPHHGFDQEEILDDDTTSAFEPAFEPTRRVNRSSRTAGNPDHRVKSTSRHTMDSLSSVKLSECAVLVSDDLRRHFNFADEVDGSDREGPEAELVAHGTEQPAKGQETKRHSRRGDQQETWYPHGDREETWCLRARKETKERRTTRQTKSLSPVSLTTSESCSNHSTVDSPQHKHRLTTSGPTSCARRQSKRRRHASTPTNDLVTSRCSPRSCKLSGKAYRGYARTRPRRKESSPEEVIPPMHKRGFQLKAECFEIVDKVYNHPLSSPFRSEIRSFRVQDYYKIVKFPMCLDTIASKLRQGTYQKLEEFVSDMKRIFWNCRLYYGTADLQVVRNAAYVERLMNRLLHKHFPNHDFSGISGSPHHSIISHCCDNRASPISSAGQVHIPLEIRQLLG